MKRGIYFPGRHYTKAFLAGGKIESGGLIRPRWLAVLISCLAFFFLIGRTRFLSRILLPDWPDSFPALHSSPWLDGLFSGSYLLSYWLDSFTDSQSPFLLARLFSRLVFSFPIGWTRSLPPILISYWLNSFPVSYSSSCLSWTRFLRLKGVPFRIKGSQLTLTRHYWIHK